MATSSYMIGRKSYLKGGNRPQAILFSDNPGTLQDGYYIPNGEEWEDFIILTDSNRQEISMAAQRIENRQRMINGNMRSYWTADKLTLSTSWNRIPSRAYSSAVSFNQENGEITNDPSTYTMYTADGGAGGVDILNWYEDHQGPFWVFLSYDKFRFEGVENFDILGNYSQVLKMYISSFEYAIEKRGGNNYGNPAGVTDGYDFWNITLSLEEV